MAMKKVRGAAAPARQLARVRRICVALPEVTERPSHGAPTWFAGKKVFATFWNDHHGDGHVAVLVPAPPGVQEQLIARDARTYYHPPYVGVKGWVGIEVARVTDETLRFHVETAWEMVAPRKVVRAVEDAPRRSTAARARKRAAGRKPASGKPAKKN